LPCSLATQIEAHGRIRKTSGEYDYAAEGRTGLFAGFGNARYADGITAETRHILMSFRSRCSGFLQGFWSAKESEAVVGADLQYIRMNGTVVGGALHLLAMSTQ